MVALRRVVAAAGSSFCTISGHWWMLMLTPKQNVAWRDHLERQELRRHLFYGGARPS